MTNEKNDINNNPWKIISIIGIPITAILTWAFAAGGLTAEVKTNSRDIVELRSTFNGVDTRIRTLELGIVRIETQYKQILDTLTEIKSEIKNDIKNGTK